MAVSHGTGHARSGKVMIHYPSSAGEPGQSGDAHIYLGLPRARAMAAGGTAHVIVHAKRSSD